MLEAPTDRNIHTLRGAHANNVTRKSLRSAFHIHCVLLQNVPARVRSTVKLPPSLRSVCSGFPSTSLVIFLCMFPSFPFVRTVALPRKCV